MESSDCAVVIGASIGGLVAARALSDTYTRVVVVDRDALPDRPATRRGVPQGRHLHALLAGGLQALERLFPGLRRDLVASGAPMGDLQGELYWYNDGHRLCPATTGLTILGASRPLLEHAIRTRVAALPGVEIVERCEVLGLTTTPDRTRVTGVRMLPVGTGAAEQQVLADLVVDAGGRGSRSPVWLDELGYQRAPEETVRIDVTYVTRYYRREPGHLQGNFGAGGGAYPGVPRAGGVFAQDGERFALSLTGMLGEEPPTDDVGMARYADSLPAPQIAEIIRSADPLDPPQKMRYPASTRRRYERLRRFPEGYLVMADALCSFNPIYGQGMTVAAMEALLLRRLLTAGTGQLAKRFFHQAAQIIDNPWSIAVGADLRFPGVQGRRPPLQRLTNAYIGRFHAAATRDPALGAAFLRVINLIDPPARLFVPEVVARVLRASRQRPASA
ncbi:FAD-dependent oxidoreductase [Micromonospora luteifusca]|uniref:FAD-dependent oxidoreductase n=1 Tax=Micromonospora luteifusca TaxID=709860 RepID=UPI0033AFBA3C